MRSHSCLLVAVQVLATFAALGCGSEPEAGVVDTKPAPVPSPAVPPSTPPAAPAKPARLSLRYVGPEGPAADVTVVFHDAEGVVLETARTDAAGVAVSREGVAAQATLVESVAGRPSLLTYTGLEAGDEIIVAPQVTGSGFVRGTLPTFAGATRYHLDANGCSGERLQTAGMHTVPLDHCKKDAVYTLLGVARNDDNLPLAYAHRSGMAAMGSTDLVWAAPKEIAVDVRNGSPSTSVLFRHVIDGHPVGTTGGGDLVGAPVLLRVAGQATEIDLTLLDRTRARDTETERTLVVRAPAQQAISADFAAALPAPAMLGAQKSAENRTALGWTWAAPVTATGAAVSANWMTKTANGSKSVGVWTFVLPPSATAVVTPSLPADIAAGFASGDPTILTLELTASAAPADYRGFRTHYRDGATATAIRSTSRTTRTTGP